MRQLVEDKFLQVNELKDLGREVDDDIVSVGADLFAAWRKIRFYRCLYNKD